MSCYVCERCQRFLDGDYDTYHVTRLPGETEDKATCEDCLGDIEFAATEYQTQGIMVDYEPYTPPKQ